LFVQASATQVSDDNLKSVFREKSRWLQEWYPKKQKHWPVKWIISLSLFTRCGCAYEIWHKDRFQLFIICVIYLLGIIEYSVKIHFILLEVKCHHVLLPIFILCCQVCNCDPGLGGTELCGCELHRNHQEFSPTFHCPHF
jgi:hypothetical protein